MKHILVIGGTGFLGFHLVKGAKKRGYKVTSISLNNPKKKRFIKDVAYIKADISNLKILQKKIRGNFDYVVNAGGYGKHPNFGREGNKLFKSHFFGLVNILKVLSLKKIKRFVQIGSSAEYGKAKSPLKENVKCDPRTPYSIAKLSKTILLQSLHQTYKFPTTILRLFQVYGPAQDNNRILPFLIYNCLKNKKFKTTKGEQICDFIYIDDVVNAIFKSFKSKKSIGEIINIGSGKPIKIKKIILIIKKIIGKGNPIIGGLKYKKETNKKNFPSIYKAKSKLGWLPKIKLTEGLIKTIKSYE
tara:strand:- start:1076 stop:1978 length:903 start_codon:yes stop_codon:yes gene_type:complete